MVEIVGGGRNVQIERRKVPHTPHAANKLPSPISMRNARRTLRVCPLYPPALMSLPEERAAQMSSQALRSFSTLRVIFHARLNMLVVDNAAAGH